jgi:hypothetical protein
MAAAAIQTASATDGEDQSGCGEHCREARDQEQDRDQYRGTGERPGQDAGPGQGEPDPSEDQRCRDERVDAGEHPVAEGTRGGDGGVVAVRGRDGHGFQHGGLDHHHGQ